MSLQTELRAALPWIIASVVLLVAVLGYLAATAPPENRLPQDYEYGVM